MEYLSERHVTVLVAGLGAYREQCRNHAALNLEQGRERVAQELRRIVAECDELTAASPTRASRSPPRSIRRIPRLSSGPSNSARAASELRHTKAMRRAVTDVLGPAPIVETGPRPRGVLPKALRAYSHAADWRFSCSLPVQDGCAESVLGDSPETLHSAQGGDERTRRRSGPLRPVRRAGARAVVGSGGRGDDDERDRHVSSLNTRVS
jgi:hypothetical protein